MSKILLSITVYVGLVLMLGFVLALLVPRETIDQEIGEDEM